jgi:hypothetical protein
MALTADLEIESVPGVCETRSGLAGAADTLYKGAILMIETDGYLEVATSAAGTVAVGICKKQHVVAGSHAERIEYEVGQFWLAHDSAAQADVGELFYATADDTIVHNGAQNTTDICLGRAIDFKTGYLLIDTREKV